MEILIFFLVISNVKVILSEDNLASVESIADEDGFNVHSDQDRDFLSDQVAESSHIVRHHYGNVVASGKLKEVRDGSQNQVRQTGKLSNSGVQSHGLKESSSSLIPIQYLQQGLHPQYIQQQQQQQPQHLLLQQYPGQQIQILNAEASPLQQTLENKVPQILGYSSYVEHLSDNEEDEINSALRQGSVSDIKRLVPKSGISFTIYPNGKNIDSQNSGTQLNQIAQLNPKPTEVPSLLLQKIKSELPPAQPVVLSDVHQTSFLDQTILKNNNVKEQHTSGTPQQLVQPHGQYQQNRNTQTVYYAPPPTHSTLVEAKEKSPPLVKPRFKTTAVENNHQKQTTATELQRNLKSSIKSSKNNIVSVEKQNIWHLNDKGDSFQKAAVPVKNLEGLSYTVAPLTQTEGNTKVTYTQNFGNGAAGLSFNKPKIENSFLETSLQDSGNFITNAYSTKLSQNNFVEHLTSVPHLDKKVILSHLPGHFVNAEEVKTGHFGSQLGTTTPTQIAFKGDQFVAADTETAKSNHHSLITQVPNNYLEIKNIQNFDHQKALQGSTSFDLKNAIDSNGNLVYQTEHMMPTAEIHPVDNSQKQQLTYVIPRIPSSAIIIDNNVHNAEAGGQQTKDFGQSGVTSQISYQNAADVGGKFFYQPQTIQLTSEHFNQGTPIATKDLHQHLLRLHLPKEEVYVKTQNVGYPITLPQQKQPFVLHYELPFVKSSSQEHHMQPATKTRFQTNQVNHFKLAQPVTLDWNLVKSGLPNYSINSVGVKTEVQSHAQESGKKIVPIIIRKRKNRSNAKQEVGIVYGKVSTNRRPTKPNHRQEKNIRLNLLPEASSNINEFIVKPEKENEFSVSASYKVD